jgi:hypothetical protein
VLAYVFWHRPRAGVEPRSYEESEITFHRSLAHSPPVGLLGTAAFRVPELPWPSPEGPGYEDWYVLEDFAALGVLGEAAVGRGHRSAHDGAARRFGAGAGGLYALIEGDHSRLQQPGPELAGAPMAVWAGREPGTPMPAGGWLIGELLGDGADPARLSLWRRQLLLGPAPEYCLLCEEEPAGVAPGRLPGGWSARALEREAIFGG